VEKFLARKFPGQEAPGNRAEERKKLSTLRLKIAERLVSVKNETAMLTTFNEINMRKLLSVKEKYSEDFKQRHGEGIGLITFFARACTVALSEFPQVNSILDGEELIIPRYVDLGIAVSTPKGLMVPVIRNTESMNMEEIGLRIKEMASKARENRITIDDMKGGTFTITNGGVFGSLLSTPILNPPQSAILGLHKIMDRPVAVEGRIEIHPMMYIALSYDHRVIDGKESVGFVIRIKELIEEPEQMLSSDTTRQTV
jgi:2-oxoglutarate dehydrogenase E2 component (dihydrolipoamide succinyltransferase)